MAKIVTIHQPNYLPWIGLFSRVKHTDCFVMADIMPFTRRSVTHRNKIKINSGWHYLTVPISSEFELARICDVKLPTDNSWQQSHWKLISDSYAKTDFFSQYKDFFKELYEKHFDTLSQLNEEIIRHLFTCFDIKVEILKASELIVDADLKKTDLIIELLKQTHADVYLSGPSGKEYLETEKFTNHNIELRYFRFEHPVYKQRFVNFEPNMSAIDLLFNIGPQASEILKISGNIEENQDH
jgi:hypothetical protein